MKNKIGYEINPESKAVDILRDNRFLRLLKVFVLEFDTMIQNKELENLKTQLSSKDFLTDFNEKNDYNLFNQIIAFLSDEKVKPHFFNFLSNFNIEQEYLNLFLEVGDFLEKTYVDSTEYPKGFYNASDKYKTNISDILGKNELTDPQYKLLEILYPTISPFSFNIIEVDINNSFTKQSVLGGEETFVYCRDEQNNIFYMNYLGEMLKDTENKIIKEIDYKKTKTFLGYQIFKFTNEDNKKKIGITTNTWKGSIIDFEAYDFAINKFSYIEDALGDDGIIYYDKEEVLDLLHIYSENGSYYLDKKLTKLNLLDLFHFINKNNPLLIDDIEERLGRFSELDVDNIYKIHNYNGLKFIELEVETESFSDEYGNTDYEVNDCVMMENGKVLIDSGEFGNKYIKSLGNGKDFLGKTFLSFKLNKNSSVDGFIDFSGEVVKIKDKKLFDINFLSEIEGIKVYGINSYYKNINGKKRKLYSLVLKEKELLKELSKYKGFKEIGTEFDIVMEDNEVIKLKDTKYDKITGLIKDNGRLKLYLCKGKYREEVEYEFLLKNLKSSETGKKALKMLTDSLKEFERVGLI